MKILGHFLISLVFLLEGCWSGDFRTIQEPAESASPTPLASPIEKIRAKPIPTIPITEVDDRGHGVQVISRGGKFCEGYLIRKSSADRASDLSVSKLDKSSIDAEATKPPLSEWLHKVSDDTVLHAHNIRSNGKTATLMATPNRASGLAVNYRNWYLEVNGSSLSFSSLSDNPSLIFWDRDGTIKLYTVQFTKEFIIDKNWKNLRLDVLLYQWNGSGEYRLIAEERNLVCK